MDFPEIALLGGGDSPVPGKLKRGTRQSMQQQHLLLLHAHKCQQREAQSQVDGNVWRCQLARCEKMKGILNHMISCPSDKKCICSASRQRMKLFTCCKREDCPVCVQRKEWQMSITAEQRSHIVSILKEAYCCDVYCDTELLSTKMMEVNMYEKADTLSEYYRMLAAKKWEIEMDIEEKRKQAHEMMVNWI